jgi:SAM-dependent methyltransferase
MFEAILETLKTRLRRAPAGAHQASHQAPGAAAAIAPESVEAPEAAVPAARGAEPIDSLQLAEWLWGAGFVHPDSAAEALDLVRPFNLERNSRLLEISAGLGGAAVAVSSKFGCRITGLERDPEMVRRSAKTVVNAPDVSMKLLAGGPYKFPTPRSDHVYGRFALHDMPDREKFLDGLGGAMKPGGHLALVEYVPAQPDSPHLKAWTTRLKRPSDPWTIEKWRQVLGSLGFDLRIEEDISEPHRKMILSGWAQLLESNRLAGRKKRQLSPLIDEAERWMLEAAAIDAGALRVNRLYAISAK